MNQGKLESEQAFGEALDDVDAGIERLEAVIEGIGMPAAAELRRRVDALKVEEKALRRNFREASEGGRDGGDQMEKVETLLRHIEREESSVEHEAEFLRQSPPSTVVMAAEAGARIVDKVGRGVKKALGNPVSESMVFVNHSHDTLVERYGLEEDRDQES